MAITLTWASGYRCWQPIIYLPAERSSSRAVFGIGQSGADLERGKLEAAAYEAVAQELMKRFGFKKVAITLRRSLSASENEWSACMHDGENFMLSREHRIFIVDRVGAGDAFAAGLIYGLISGWSDKDALEFGVAASCLKHSIRGDFNLVTVAEVERLAAGRTGGRVQR